MKNTQTFENQFYKNLMDNLYDGVYFVDGDRCITYWNNGAERITGYQSANVIGRPCNSNILNHITEAGQHLCEDGCRSWQLFRMGCRARLRYICIMPKDIAYLF